MLSTKTPNELARQQLKKFEPVAKEWGYSKTQSEIDSLPETYHCEKHGDYRPRIGNSPFPGKQSFNSLCVKCVTEFDILLNKREAEITEERRLRAVELKAKNRIELLKRRGVGKRYLTNSFDNYVVDTPEKQNALDKSRELCHSVITNNSPSNLIMVGGVGTGKTHLANSVVIALTDKGHDCGRVNMIDMIRRLKSTWSKDSEETEEEVLDIFINAELLIIDEVGVQFNSDTEKMFIFDIINGRYDECLPTVIISNLDIAGVKDVMGERCIDRLREDGGKVVAFNWESHR